MSAHSDILHRRGVLRLLSGSAAFAASAGGMALLASGGASWAGPSRAKAAVARAPKLPGLIEKSRALPEISARIAAISQGLLGTRYRGHTLIGGPKTSEIFVTREDDFDCVTFCETVLAAALSRKPDDFVPALRAIRYHDGIVTYYARNHYFHEWCVRNVANGLCREVALPGMATIEKTVTWHREFEPRHFTMRVIPAKSFLDNHAMLRAGDIAGFVTRRASLDYFHTGFVMFGAKGEFLLRHAAESRRRVIDEPMARFMRANRVRYVTVLRPRDPAAGTTTSKI
jgi:hypothetical protein